ncbi:hypothetical protein N7G274_008373 [Stereocaulon virgatum]|uniref:C2H2-type domain-containing protein n=1 Tax=Stereocaulon virgatum TaxID=373712 RepID=A0ABR4A1J3_9LECA
MIWHHYVNLQDSILDPPVSTTVPTSITCSTSSGSATPSQAPQLFPDHTYSDFLPAQTIQIPELDPGLNTFFDHDNNVEYEQLAATCWEFDPFFSVPGANKITHSLETPLSMSPVPHTSLDHQFSINSLGRTGSGTAPLPVSEYSCSSPTEAQDVQSLIGTEHDVPKRPIPYHCSTCSKTFSHRHKLHKHEKSHRRDFKCEISTCTSGGFYCQKDLVRHLDSCHKDVAQAERYCCPHMECEYAIKGFPRRDNCQRHIRTQH